MSAGELYDDCVWVSPSRLGGTPCVGGHRISTEQVARAVWVGYGHEYVKGTDSGWDLTERQVLIACWYEVWYGRERSMAKIRRAWADWADIARDELWPTGGMCAWPPTREELEAA